MSKTPCYGRLLGTFPELCQRSRRIVPVLEGSIQNTSRRSLRDRLRKAEALDSVGVFKRAELCGLEPSGCSQRRDAIVSPLGRNPTRLKLLIEALPTPLRGNERYL